MPIPVFPTVIAGVLLVFMVVLQVEEVAVEVAVFFDQEIIHPAINPQGGSGLTSGDEIGGVGKDVLGSIGGSCAKDGDTFGGDFRFVGVAKKDLPDAEAS